MKILNFKRKKCAFTMAEVFLPHFAGCRKHAFTMAEVLITMSVIGIVAALTIPNLMNNTTKKTQAEKIHKAMVELSDAVELYMNDQDKNKAEVPFSSLTKVETFLTNYFRVNKNCGSDPVGKGCLSATYKTISGLTGQKWSNGPYLRPSKFKCMNNKAGVTICMSEYGGEHKAGTAIEGTTTPASSLIDVWIDTNGNQQPNTNGRDIFRIYINNNGDLVTWGENSYASREAEFKTASDGNKCQKTGNPDACIGHLMDNNWVMDY